MRQLVTIRTVKELIPIEDADRIELAKVDGWQVIVKKGEFSVGDPGIFFEIDSMIPGDDKRFEFLSKGQVRTHYRIKTMRMKKVLSQGLFMPHSILTREEAIQIGDSDQTDLSEIFRVEKYEPSLPTGGEQKGTFPSHLISKTDQERIQNIHGILTNDFFTSRTWEMTEKLDGTSCTFYHCEYNGLSSLEATTTGIHSHIGACSRNWEMKLDDSNVYADLFKQLGLDSKLRDLGRNIALQGEIIGPGIQGNRYNRAAQEFHLFDIYDIDRKRYLDSIDRMALCVSLGLKHVPIVESDAQFAITLDDLLELADGRSALNDTNREGVVFKCVSHEEDDTLFSFKVISNRFLLKAK